jgi:DNA-binding transcriptional ArsR family regulator
LTKKPNTMSLLPSRPNLSSDAGPRVVGLDSEDADALMSALSSTTARRILASLHEDPAPPAELAARVDTSLQNTQYHLERLEEAGAVDVVGTAYSEKGREMDVYGPADEPLVIFAGRDESASGLRAALSRLVGGFAALAVGALAIQETLGPGIGTLFGTGSPPPAGLSGGADGGGDPSLSGGAGAGDAGATPTPTPEAAGASPTGATTASPTQATPQPTPGPTPQATGTDGGFSASEATETPVATGQPTSTPAPEATSAHTPIETAADTVTRTATELAHQTTEMATSGADAAGIEPGVAFFLGGATVLVAVVAFVYLR